MRKSLVAPELPGIFAIMERENKLSEAIIGAAIEVHSTLGPGMLEKTYRLSLGHELEMRGFRILQEVPVDLCYKDLVIPRAYFMDMVVEDLVVLELKAVDSLIPAHYAQLLTYLRYSHKRLGLLMNFNETLMKKGIARVIK